MAAIRDLSEGKTFKKGDEFLQFKIYTADGLTKCDGPTNPTWLYSTSRCHGCSQNPVLYGVRVIFWFLFLVPFTYVLWHLSSRHTVLKNLFNYWTIIRLNLISLAFAVAVNYFASWPAQDEAQEHENDPDYLAEIGCIVPCHKSATEIAATVKSLLTFLRPEHIVVVDNGNSYNPLDDTPRRIKELNPHVTYMWVPIGMKTNALWMGLNKLPSAVRFVMHIDDDTECPQNMVFDQHVWDNPNTDAVSYGICIYQTGLVEKFVDFEFKQISQLRLFQSRYSSVWFQHGIIGIWRREAFTEVLKEHPFLPFGEDNWSGTINLVKNRQMRQELRSCVSSYAPATLLPYTGDRQQGYGAANIWKQRAERWFVNAPRRFFIRLYLLFCYRHDTCVGNIVFRCLTLWHLLEIYVHLTLPLSLIAYFMSSLRSWVFIGTAPLVQLGMHWFQICIQNYVFWRHRPDIQIDFKICLLVPFYHWFLQVCYWYGHWRCLLYYIPFVPSRHGLYTEGEMNGELLEQLHNIKTLHDVADDSMNQLELTLDLNEDHSLLAKRS